MDSFKKKTNRTTEFTGYATCSNSKPNEWNQKFENTTRIDKSNSFSNGNKQIEVDYSTTDKTDIGRREQGSESYFFQSQKNIQKEQAKPGSCRKWSHEIETHKRKFGVENLAKSSSSTDANFMSLNRSLFVKESNDCNVVKHNSSSTLQFVKDNTLFTQESGKRFLTKTAEALKGVKKIIYDPLSNYFTSNINGDTSEDTLEVALEADAMRNLDEHKMHEVETLRQAVSYFTLGSYLQDLDNSLEDVRRYKKTREDHEEFFEKIDKNIQKLSFKYHPDRVRNRGGTEVEMARAQQLQTALNATRSALKVLNKAFLVDLNTYHSFSLYENLHITSLCNEKEIKCRIYEVNFKIGWISGIKRQKIIPEILKFLVESKECVSSYLRGSVNDFIKFRDLSFFHLKRSIEGYQKLCSELETVDKESKSENDKSLDTFIQRMIKDSKRNLHLLKLLEEAAKESLNGKYHFFTLEEYFDSYFVLPFVWFTNIMIMCSVMIKGVSFWDQFKPKVKYDSNVNDELFDLVKLHYLVLYYNGDDRYENFFVQLLCKLPIQNDYETQNRREKIERVFRKTLDGIMVDSDSKFNVENYKEIATKQNVEIDYKECETLLSQFQKKKEELSKRFDLFEAKTTEVDEEFNRMMKDFLKMERKIEENLEKSKKFNEYCENKIN